MTNKAEDVKHRRKLGDIANVAVGQILTRVTNMGNEGKAVPVLSPKAIVSGAINKDDLGEAVLTKDIDEKKYTKEGDVVIKLSTPYDAAYVTEEMAGLVIPSFCAVVRAKEDAPADTKYLSAFLNSSYVRDQLVSKVVGSTRPMLKISDINGLEIPEVTEQDMRDIGEAYFLSGRKKLILNEMIKAEEKLMESIVLASIKGVERNE